jgi:hypothetical protein
MSTVISGGDGASVGAAGNQSDGALAQLQTAHRLSPDNVPIAMQLADLHERADDYVAALDVYVRLTNRWPDVVQPRYRLAAVLGMSEDWAPGARRSPDDRLRLARLPTPADGEGETGEEVARSEPLSSLGADGPPDGAVGSSAGESERPEDEATREAPSADASAALTSAAASWDDLRTQLLEPDATVVRQCLLEASSRWRQLEQHLGWWRSWRRLLALGDRRRDRDWRYQRQFTERAQRRRLRSAVQLAGCTTEAQLLCPAPEGLPDEAAELSGVADLVTRIEQLVDVRGLDSDGYYNGACAFARLYELTGDASHLERSLALLVRAAAEGDHARVEANMEQDADLVSVVALRSVLVWCRKADPDDAWWCIRAWGDRICSDLTTWWDRWGAIAESDPTLAAAWRADASLFDRMLDLFAPAEEQAAPVRTSAQLVVDLAASLHLRVGLPPEPSMRHADADLRSRVAVVRERHRSTEAVPPERAFDLRRARWEALRVAVRLDAATTRGAGRGGQP